MTGQESWRNGYDAWKTASPYDDEVEPGFIECYACHKLMYEGETAYRISTMDDDLELVFHTEEEAIKYANESLDLDEFDEDWVYAWEVTLD